MDSYRYFPIGAADSSQKETKETEGAGERDAFPRAVGFHWPAEASTRIPFSSLVWKYIQAKEAAEQQGYKLPLQEFYQKDRGLPWCELMEGEYRSTVREAYDPRAEWNEEAFRPMIVDCQRDLKKFFWTVFKVSASGEVRELERGEASSWGDVKASERGSVGSAPEPPKPGEALSLAEVQRKWKVRDQHVLVDCGYQMTQVLRECVRHGHVGAVKVAGKVRKVWLCWTGMKGSGQELFKHENPRTKLVEYRIYSVRKFYDTNIGTQQRQPRSPWYEWSNLHCKDLLRARRDGDTGIPKYLTLPDTLPATDPWSYFAQMRSEKRVEVYQNGRKRAIWLPVKQTRPNHEWDKGSMLMAFMGIVGIIGAPEVDGEGEPGPEGGSA
jgi:hypothetical protein